MNSAARGFGERRDEFGGYKNRSDDWAPDSDDWASDGDDLAYGSRNAILCDPLDVLRKLSGNLGDLPKLFSSAAILQVYM